ncbi:MAG: DUF3179 domain-containing (seleno)protein [Candidatus Micrarchaeota archaeon]
MKYFFFFACFVLLLGCVEYAPSDSNQSIDNQNRTLPIPSFSVTPVFTPQPTPDIKVAEPQELIPHENEFVFKESSGVKHLVPLNTFIPFSSTNAITWPKFAKASNLNLNGEALILGLNFSGVAKAYPLSIMNWHQVVNDEANGVPIVVSFSPACFTRVAFKRVLNGKTVVFEVSDYVFKNNLLLVDSASLSLWHQFTGLAIKGELSGSKLDRVPLQLMKMSDWLVLHNDSKVLLAPENTDLPYNQYPYGDYESNERIFFEPSNRDLRLRAKEVVLGINSGDYYRAYKVSVIPVVLNDEFNGEKLLVLRNPVTNETRVFDRVVNGTELLFFVQNSSLFDSKSKSSWNFDGKAIKSTSFKGVELLEISSMVSYWFTWSMLYPETSLIR